MQRPGGKGERGGQKRGGTGHHTKKNPETREHRGEKKRRGKKEKPWGEWLLNLSMVTVGMGIGRRTRFRMYEWRRPNAEGENWRDQKARGNKARGK